MMNDDNLMSQIPEAKAKERWSIFEIEMTTGIGNENS